MLVESFDRIIQQRGLLTEDVVGMGVLRSCYGAIDEFTAANESATDVLNVAYSYTESIIYTLLENIRAYLLELYQKVLSAFNNYILNQVHLCDKYRDMIMERYDKLKKPVRYKTYEYPELYKLPIDIRPSGKAEDFAKEIIAIGEDPEVTHDRLSYDVDQRIKEFSDSVLGTKIDPTNVKNDTRRVCYDRMRGRSLSVTLNKKDLSKFIDEIQNHQKMKKELQKTKSEIEAYYKSLRSKFSGAFKMTKNSSNELVRMKDPDKVALLDRQVMQYSTASIELKRLFNGFITIYSESFTSKLEIMQEHVDINRAVIVEIMTRTNIFYSPKYEETKNKNRNTKRYDDTQKFIL